MRPYRTFRLQWKRGRAAGGRWVMHRRIAGPLLLLLTLFLVPEAWGAVRYVSKSGTDNAACTQAAPCRTIQHAVNIAGSGDTISIGKGKFEEFTGVGIGKNLTLNGAGTFSTRVVTYWVGSVFQIGSGANVTITGLDVMDGTADYAGGGISNQGNLTLHDVRVWKNSAQFGGGIFNDDLGTLSISRSEIAHNSASYGGGGLYNLGVAMLDEVRIVANYSAFGGGIANIMVELDDFLPISDLIVTRSEISYNDPDGIDNVGSMSLINTTVSHNNLRGITIELGADTELIHATVADNGKNGPDPDYLHGGILVVGGSSIDLINTIVANNAPVQCRLRNPQSITPVFATGILIGDATCGTFFLDSHTLVGVDPKLGPLKWNGGFTDTHALKAGSPAIDAGNPDHCELVDQRGVSRPIDGNGDGVANCDIGAFEYQPKGTVDQ